MNASLTHAEPIDRPAGMRILRFLLPWAAALIVAFLLDPSVAQWMYDWRPAIPRHFIEYQNGPISRNDTLARLVRSPGDFRFTLAVAGVLLILHRDRWKAAGFVLLSGIASGSNSLIKWVFGRTRPLRGDLSWGFFNGGLVGIVEHTDVSFPSGHAALAFATAEALAILLPRWRGWFYAGAALVGMERIAENAHYLSDVVAGAFWGVLCCRAVLWIADLVTQRRPPARAPDEGSSVRRRRHG